MLPDDSASQLLDHIGSCSMCEAALDTIKEADDTLLRLLRESAPQDPYEGEIQRAEAFVRAKAMSAHVLERDGPASGEAVNQEAPLQLGEYELLEKLGEGGMGVVYRARQAKLKKIVALKVLTRGRIADAEAVARFEREMEALGAVDHPNIVRAMDAREIEGTPVLVTEYVEGLDLSELVHRLGPLRISDACELIRQAAVGLQYAHQRGLVHRDIKPSNVMLSTASTDAPSQGDSRRGVVKVLDLGLARWDDRELGEAGELTGSGRIMGTPDYMAPEQFSDSHAVDIRADVYGLGATLYKLLCGRAPLADRKFKTPAQRLMALASEPVPPIQEHRPDVPNELAQVLDRMLAKDPEQRYAAPGDVADALVPFADGADLSALIAEAKTASEPPVEMAQKVDTNAVRPSALVGTKPSCLRKQRRARRDAPPRRRKLLGLIAGAAVVLAAVATITLKTGEVTVEIIVNQPGVKVRIDDDVVEVESPDGKIIVSVPVGPHRIEIGKDGFETQTKSFTIRWRWDKPRVVINLTRVPAIGWPHAGQNLQDTNFHPERSSQVLEKLAFEVLWDAPRGIGPRTADLDGDGDLEIIYLENIGRARRLVALDETGTRLWKADPVADSGVTDSDAQTDIDYDIADVNGDRACEIVVNVNCNVSWTENKPNYILIYKGDGTRLRRFSVEPGAEAHPRLADVDGDGSAEIVVGLADFRGEHGAYIYRLDGELTGRTLTGERLVVSAIADIDSDGAPETLFNNFAAHCGQSEVNGVDDLHAHIVAVDGDGSLIWVHRIGSCSAWAAVADLSGDGKLDIVAFRNQDAVSYPGPNEVHLLDNTTGQSRASYAGPENAEWKGCVIADLNGDERQEIVVGNEDGLVRVLDSDLELIREQRWPTIATVFAGNDLDGDGSVELVVGSGTTVFVLDGDLETLSAVELDEPVRDAIVSDIDLDGRNDIVVQTKGRLVVLRSEGVPPLSAKLMSAHLAVRVETGTAVDIQAIAKDRATFPNTIVDEDRVTFEIPSRWFNYDAYTNSGIQPLPRGIRLKMTISKDGTFECGAFAGEPGDALAMFVDTLRDEGAIDFFGFANCYDAYLRPLPLEPAETCLHPYTCLDRRQNGLACAVAMVYWTCATKEYIDGEADTFEQLYGRNWWFWNGCGSPITVLKSCLYCDTSKAGKKGFSARANSLWCPKQDAASAKESSFARAFDLNYRDAKAAALILHALNDNGQTAQIDLDGKTMLKEGGRERTIGRAIQRNAFPKSVKLAVERPQGTSCTSVVVAQLGGELEATNIREQVDGVNNPPDSNDDNPPPMTLHLPTGWSRDGESSR